MQQRPVLEVTEVAPTLLENFRKSLGLDGVVHFTTSDFLLLHPPLFHLSFQNSINCFSADCAACQVGENMTQEKEYLVLADW